MATPSVTSPEQDNKNLQTHSRHILNLLFPDLKPDEYDTLKQSIKKDGLRDAIIKYEGVILDGRYRYQACKELGIEPRFEHLPEDKAYLYHVVKQNVLARNLSKKRKSQRALIAAGLVVHLHHDDDSGSKVSKTSLIKEVVKLLDVSSGSIWQAIPVLEHDDSDLRYDLIKRIKDKGLSVGAANAIVVAGKPPPDPPPTPDDTSLHDSPEQFRMRALLSYYGLHHAFQILPLPGDSKGMRLESNFLEYPNGKPVDVFVFEKDDGKYTIKQGGGISNDQLVLCITPDCLGEVWNLSLEAWQLAKSKEIQETLQQGISEFITKRMS